MGAKRFFTNCMARQTTKKIITLIVLSGILLSGFFWHIYYTYIEQKDGVFHHLPPKYARRIHPPTHLQASFVLLPRSYLKGQKKLFFSIFVKSSPNHFSRRQAIRRTWGSVQFIDNMEIDIVFLIGISRNAVVNKLIKSESSCYGDILQTNLTDTFHSLTTKTLSALKWIFDQRHSKASFYIFTDDDCVINLHNTVTYLKQKNPMDRSMYCGFMFEKNSGVIRGSGKLSVTSQQYSESIYPDFCRGVMVMLTYKMAIDLYLASTITDYQSFPLEDVMVYGILRHKISFGRRTIYPVINGGHPLVFYPWDDSDTVVQKMISKWREYAAKLYFRHSVEHRIHSKLKCLSFRMELKAVIHNLRHASNIFS